MGVMVVTIGCPLVPLPGLSFERGQGAWVGPLLCVGWCFPVATLVEEKIPWGGGQGRIGVSEKGAGVDVLAP